ncbi:Proclotting enzyme-like protein [Leptotrombidium deliense]|uniref:Proclotting enzyme-like protein n=1 Tax=Leptotrombidium deliense TaxID=299467 RepID=A0A443SHG5_9ACAR|nr:Proclotting enzyme-like protein [Leptotrombidium deliense]
MFDSNKSSPILYPWMGALFKNSGEQLCGATIISDQFILTAAHCVHSLKPQELKVILGVHNLVKATAEDKYAVSKIVAHEKYIEKDSQYNDDIALLKLEKPLKFSYNLLPICQPKKDMIKFEHNLNAIGWGQLQPDSDEMAQKLQEIYLPEVPREKCGKIWEQDLGDNRLCVGEEMKNVCKGDDGGPLMYSVNSIWHQVGITSFSGPICGDKYPGVFTRVSYYIDWIQEHIKGSNTCAVN